MTRRQKFREYMAHMSATAEPKLALKQLLYVKPPDAISEHIVHRFEIEPSSRHLVVGGIGAGKTTQLLTARDSLAAHEDVHAEYIDVSEKQDLTKVQPGCLVALAGLCLNTFMEEDKVAAPPYWSNFLNWGHGYWEYPEDIYNREPDDGSRWQPGIVKPPKPWVDIPNGFVSLLREAHTSLLKGGKSLILLFDSLDRMTDTQAFTRLVEQDIAALQHAGIGVVIVGPIRSLTGFGRLEVEHFDYLHVQAPIDVQHDEQGRAFLYDVLRRRAAPDVLTDETVQRLVQLSGGVLRDLIYLAKAAGDEAYRQGADIIGVEHANKAADSYGRTLLVGLKQEELETLRHLRTTGGFVRVSEGDLALIATRRILEYHSRSAPVVFAVHPTIAPLLDQMATRA